MNVGVVLCTYICKVKYFVLETVLDVLNPC
jgi:hypothetical protein